MNEPSRFYSTPFLLTLVVVLLCVDVLAETHGAPAFSFYPSAVVLVLVVPRALVRE
ncbi:hypothetical protein [Halopelagius longus]|uniref:Uncharacterized protein n=1 Tax=Halopelagius longus TaxID=1236180 RepID=A0A1H0Y2W7_9EURY|nr:hypothetical protein [Halopelagius longus]SDQ09519.1 hypothetical protein SAMN05216278_0368 [Halopelagius longus]